MALKFKPDSKLGKWSCGFISALIFLVIIATVVANVQVPIADQTFLSNPMVSILMLCAGISAVLAFLTGIIAILKDNERSFLVFLGTMLGFFILIFVAGELIILHE